MLSCTTARCNCDPTAKGEADKATFLDPYSQALCAGYSLWCSDWLKLFRVIGSLVWGRFDWVKLLRVIGSLILWHSDWLKMLQVIGSLVLGHFDWLKMLRVIGSLVLGRFDWLKLLRVIGCPVLWHSDWLNGVLISWNCSWWLTAWFCGILIGWSHSGWLAAWVCGVLIGWSICSHWSIEWSIMWFAGPEDRCPGWTLVPLARWAWAVALHSEPSWCDQMRRCGSSMGMGPWGTAWPSLTPSPGTR